LQDTARYRICSIRSKNHSSSNPSQLFGGEGKFNNGLRRFVTIDEFWIYYLISPFDLNRMKKITDAVNVCFKDVEENHFREEIEKLEKVEPGVLRGIILKNKMCNLNQILFLLFGNSRNFLIYPLMYVKPI